jgi:xanthine dehydrogenase accessory factor
MQRLILIRGGGDLASGVALRLQRAGMRVVIAELAQPQMVRRAVSFGEAVYAGQVTVEDVEALRVADIPEAGEALDQGKIAVLVDPELSCLGDLRPIVLVDARMTKRPPETGLDAAPLVIGLGPGFSAADNCHAVVETQRGHSLGRVFWQGSAAEDTGVPGSIASHNLDRVLRAPKSGQLQPRFAIGDHVRKGEIIAVVDGEAVLAPFDGVLRGLVHSSLLVTAGMKIGDLDPRNEPVYCFRVSDKALAIGGGVLEAMLARPEIRGQLWP